MHTSMTLTRFKVKSRHFWTSENCTLLCLSPLPFWPGAQNWWLVMISWDLIYSLLDPAFKFPSQKAITWVQTLQNVNIIRNSKSHISVLLEARVTWSGMLVVLYVLFMMTWPWPDPRSRLTWGRWPQTRYGAFYCFCQKHCLPYNVYYILGFASVYKCILMF